MKRTVNELKMKQTKNPMTVILSFAVALSLLPATAFAQSAGTTIDMADGTLPASGTGWNYAGDVYTILNGANVTVIGDNQQPVASQRRIEVDVNAVADITLNGVSIDVSATTTACAFNMSGANDLMEGTQRCKKCMNTRQVHQSYNHSIII